MRIPVGNFGNLTPQATTGRVGLSHTTAVGAALSGTGATLSHVAEGVQKAQNKKDLAATQAALLDLDSKSNERWENPETGALTTRQGFHSAGVGQDMGKLDSSDYLEARQRIPATQLDYFDAQWKAGQVRRESTYNSFERTQTAQAQQKQLTATVKLSVNDEGNAFDDPKSAALIRGARRHSIELYGQAQGWSAEQINQAITTADLDASEKRSMNFAVTHPQAWLSRKDKQQTGLDAATIYRIDKVAESKIREQREAARQSLDDILSNTLAQLNNGEVPDAIPDKGAIMFAYGKQGGKAVKQLNAALESALTFQRIQHASPNEQKQALAEAKPKVNDANYALKLESYNKLLSLVKRSNQQQEEARNAQHFNEALVMGQKLDPTDKAMQKAADSTDYVQQFQINNAATHDGIVLQVAQTGLVPDKVTSQLSAVSRAKDPGIVNQGAELFNRLYETDPASVGDLPKQIQSFYLTVKQFTDSGMAAESAIEQAQNLTYNQTDAMKAQLASQQTTKEYKKDRSKAMDSAAGSMSQWFRWDPSADDPTPEAVRFRNDYQSLYDINYRISGGNSDAAKKMTQQQISRTWRISEVNGSAQFMKYAPEALYPHGPEGWQAAQWQEEKSLLMYGDRSKTVEVNAAQRGDTSGRGNIIKSEMVESRIDGDLEITPDVLTPRKGDYAIMVRRKDKDGIETVQPFYDEEGRAMRWQPELTAWQPYQQMLKDAEKNAQEELSRAQAQRGFNEKRRALNEQYQRLHNQRRQNIPQFIYGRSDD
ncbi:lytic transglycosylase [Rosenbergiella australiborealis]|uniref:Lytic transglycosylase n=1 Tax=Rosenbergiella australiborealis TaxID=1544696 RepID=A0ABS5T375_9GAMM|nr:lytic transglycosylase [Rosenbergiella australiborealis]MBT0726817.1 lytic transglycosylase [Rosenbergiella australiborealis]